MELDAILRSLIARGYPELKRLRISIAFRALAADELLRYDNCGRSWEISVSDSLRGAPKPALEGGIAHELAHIVRDCRLAPRSREFAYAAYARSRPYRIRDERATELRLLARGYGRHLASFLKHARRLGYSFTAEHGLSRRELAALLRSAKR